MESQRELRPYSLRPATERGKAGGSGISLPGSPSGNSTVTGETEVDPHSPPAEHPVLEWGDSQTL